MKYNTLSKKELINIIQTLQKVLNGESVEQENDSQESLNELESLIGTIPFFLLNKDIFEKNQDIADFAKKMDIVIPTPEKKKKEDIIGRIISAIASFDKQKVSDLNKAIKALKKSDVNKGKSNFFKDWEDAIKVMKL